jgi:hypothetical protein
MKQTIINVSTAIAGVALIAGAAGFAAMPVASAQISATVGASASATVGGTSAGVDISAKGTARINALTKIITTAQTRADNEISRRIKALNTLSTRVDGMVKISADDKTSLNSTIQAQITAMNNLQTQIASDVSSDSTSSLKADIQSITKSYRIFALIIPQGAIEAGADRVLDIAGMFTTLAGNLQTRITAAQSAGNNMSASVSALADMNAKVADVNTQANAAVSEIASLQPDNGVASVMASNTATLKDARSKIQAAQQDLVAARKDAGVIVKALMAIKESSGSMSASTTVTGTGSASTTP